MNKLYLMKNSELFQGEKYLDKNYFEGWYFKNTFGSGSFSFIPGISITKDNKKAFIQVITNDISYFADYDIADFKYNHSPFLIKIGNNVFSKEGIHIDIKDKKQNLKVFGDVKYLDNIQIKNSWYSPNIMGPFSYIPFMQCNHAVISMKNKVKGIRLWKK